MPGQWQKINAVLLQAAIVSAIMAVCISLMLSGRHYAVPILLTCGRVRNGGAPSFQKVISQWLHKRHWLENLGKHQERFVFLFRCLHSKKTKHMKQHKLLRISSATLISFSALAILMVSLMAFQNPQAVMDLVQVKLPNNDAFSSIRGVYGGVGLTIAVALIYLVFEDHAKGLVFAAILWGCYALSRVMTISMEGPLGAFGQQWLLIETVLCVLSLILLAIRLRLQKAKA
jgi:hypothetical protein